MNWLNIKISQLRSEAFIHATNAQKGQWLELCAYCCTQLNSGRIQNCKNWSPTQWIKITGNTGLVGITDHAQQQLGDIVHLNLPEVGTQLKAGAAFGGVESVKSYSDLYSPASGKVTEVNETLNESPENINKDAQGAWMIKLELSNPKEADALLSADDYEKYIAEEK